MALETGKVLEFLSRSNYRIVMENLLKQVPGLESKFIFESKLLSKTIANKKPNVSFDYTLHREDGNRLEWLDEEGIREVFSEMKLSRVLGTPFEALKYSSYVLNSAVRQIKRIADQSGQEMDTDGSVWKQLCDIDEEVSESLKLIDKQRKVDPDELRLLKESLSLIVKITDVLKSNSLQNLQDMLKNIELKTPGVSEVHNDESDPPIKRQKLALCDLLS